MKKDYAMPSIAIKSFGHDLICASGFNAFEIDWIDRGGDEQ